MDTFGGGIEYRIFSEDRICEDNGEIREYGIELVYIACDIERRQRCRGISSCRDKVQELLRRLAEYRVRPAHFLEIVEDYLEELYGGIKPLPAGEALAAAE